MKKNSLRKILALFFSAQFLAFLMVGGTAALVNYFSGWTIRVLYPSLLNEVSVIVGYSVGTVISFIFNKIFTFKARDEKTVVQAVKFLLASMTSALLGAGISRVVLLIYDGLAITYINLETAANISHVIAIGLTTVYNFLAMKYFSFKKLSNKS